jgi:hypothetical protein
MQPEGALLPIDILQPDSSDFTGAQAQTRQAQQNGIIPSAPGGAPIDGV